MKKEYIEKRRADICIVLKKAQTSPLQQIETMATDINKSQHISPRDACTCTGNCVAA